MTMLLTGGVGTALALGAGAALAQVDSGDAATTDVLEVLQLNLEEGRMARDLYAALGEAHEGLMPFTHIEVSEQRHHDAVGRLLTAKDGPVPEGGIPGVYERAEIQAMYDDWLERGLASPESALEVAIELETTDIAGLRADIDQVDDEDVDRVLGHLLTSSQHHLAAFEAAAAGEELAVMPGRGMHRGGGMESGHGMGWEEGTQAGPGAMGGMHGQGMHGQGMGTQGMHGQGMHRFDDGAGDCPLRSTDDP